MVRGRRVSGEQGAGGWIPLIAEEIVAFSFLGSHRDIFSVLI